MTASDTIITAAIATAHAAADAAGAAIRPHFRTQLVTDRKADASPVTIADRNAELAMRHVIAARHPDHGILGEEMGLERAGSPWRWILDPIDGTRAFITGRPTFGTLIALMHEDVSVIGLIDQPVTGERWVCRVGEPTRFHSGYGGQAAVRQCASLADAELSATSPEMMGSALPRFGHLSGAVRRTSWGGDCYAYGLLALGQIDIVAERDLKIWDWAALVPIVQGAGGVMVDWQGMTLRATSAGDALALGDRRLLEPACSLLAEE